MLKKIKIVISAPSGAGKTTLISRLMASMPELEFSISMTTRPPRAGEVEGESYYFTSNEEFQRLIKENAFEEWAIVHGNHYGTLKKEIDRIEANGNIPIFDVVVQGSRSLHGRLDNAVFIFIIPPSIAELELRLRKRKTESDEAIRLRLLNAVEELRHFDIFDYIVVNDDCERALGDLRAILIAESCKTARNRTLIHQIREENVDNTP